MSTVFEGIFDVISLSKGWGVVVQGHDRAVHRRVVDSIAARTREVVEALRASDIAAPSLLPGWTRRTIACHLRYGAVALRQITDDALAGRPASYYLLGRAVQRPGTLEARPEEDVVASLAAESAALHDRWATLTTDGWATVAHEPDDNPDLGGQPLSTLALLRWTEVEVHGTDLGVGGPDWSPAFVAAVLPLRVARLDGRLTTVRGEWTLHGDRATYAVVADGHIVRAAPGDAGGTRIEATDRDLVALLLGRPTLDPVDAGSFRAAFPAGSWKTAGAGLRLRSSAWSGLGVPPGRRSWRGFSAPC